MLIDVGITDPKYDLYKRLGNVAAAKHGGKFLARGGLVDVLEVDWTPKRIAMIEFADRGRSYGTTQRNIRR